MDRLRLWSLLSTAVIHGAVVLAVALFASSSGVDDDDRPKLTDMVTIEAALAYKSKSQPVRQPQKPRQRAQKAAPIKPVGASRDETRVPEEPTPPTPDKQPPKPAEEPPETEDFASQFERFRELRQDGDDDDVFATDNPAGTATSGPTDGDTGSTGGAFDGSEHGFAEVNKGDPYMRELAGDANRFWVVPTLAQNSGAAAGCVQLAEDGRILDTQLLEPTSNATIDAAVKRALKKLTELRADGSRPVPAHLIQATREWICFKFPY
ncbi:MAG: hypothetical protein Tsb0020_02580 [Haliangiales bacterium]